MLPTYKKISVRLFGKLLDKYIDSFKSIKPHLEKAGIRILLRTWLAIVFFTSLLAYIISLISILILGFFIHITFSLYITLLISIPIIMAITTFSFFYIYPIEKGKGKMRSINNNLPFALSQMSSIASSGIPPEYMFDLLTGFKEYGEITEEAKLIVRNIKSFGMSSIDAIKNVAMRTPSKSFKEILLGITSTIETGGDIGAYLREMAEKALFDYRVKREKYLKTLSTYADIYTALLVAAPLMMLATLAIMSIIGGNIMGLGINDLIFLITWVFLPFLNIGFLAFVHITYPGI